MQTIESDSGSKSQQHSGDIEGLLPMEKDAYSYDCAVTEGEQAGIIHIVVKKYSIKTSVRSVSTPTSSTA